LNPLSGRFLTLDPIEADFQDPDTLHKYRYAAGDPIGKIDPTGLEAVAGTVQIDHNSFKLVLTAAVALGLYSAGPSQPDHYLKIQAQGSDFRNAGTGYCWNYRSVFPCPVVVGLFGLANVLANLDAKQIDNRSKAFTKAALWMIGCSVGGGCTPQKKSFYNDAFRNAKDAPRIDIDIFAGNAFVF
jgi:hypothetical protein